MTGHQPTRWEYETLRPTRDSAKKESIDPKAALNELGAEGWELVETVTYEGGGTKYLVLKRPRPPEDG
jgi:riboflavin biosynthesis pyrimidine reductase